MCNNEGGMGAKTGYQIAFKKRSEEEEHSSRNLEIQWIKAVWEQNTAPRVKLFLWKVFQQALPVGEILSRRNISTEVICKRCGAIESINHLFLHCNFAQKIWSLAPYAERVESRGYLDLKDVWLRLSEKLCLPPTGLSTGSLAPWIVWYIWTARNQLLFNGRLFTEEEIVSKAVISAREWCYSQEKNPIPPKKSLSRPPIPHDCLVVNSDAAWRAQSCIAGLGWTIRGLNLLSHFSVPAHSVRSALCAEGLALREALSKCKELGMKRIVCEADSAVLIKAISTGDAPSELYGILADISDLVNHFDVISFVWISREKNKAADHVAKQCLVREEAFMAIT